MPILPRPALTAALLLALLTACSAANPGGADDTLGFDGPEAGALLNANDLEELELMVHRTGADARLDDLHLLHDGTDRTHEAQRDDEALRWRPAGLDDGEHTVELYRGPSTDRAETDTGTDAGDNAVANDAAPATASSLAEDPDAELLHTWTFTVDATPPTIELTSPDGAVVAGEPMLVAGTTKPGATVTVGELEAVADDEGSFRIDIDAAPEAPLALTAVDVAGNVAEDELALVTVPSRVESDEIRTVHVSFYGWVSRLKDPIIEMVEDGRINAIQLDLKDEAGQIAYDSQVEVAREAGATLGIWDLREAVEEIHALGVPVIGRIVAFADPVLTTWAWESDRRDWVIQTPDGERYVGRYAGFSNFAHDEVREYNLAVAEEAAQAGVDHILWDYIRRPDGSLDNMHIEGLETTPEEAIVEFTRLADERLAPYGVQHGASVYGIAADRPTQIGQDIPAMAEHLDYVAPMIYPSHWGVGEYGVADPNRQPYDIVRATLEVWDEAVEGRRARVVPWLEDTPYRAWDRPFQVREQIRGAREHGIDEWLMWNPGSRFTPEAYERRD